MAVLALLGGDPAAGRDAAVRMAAAADARGYGRYARAARHLLAAPDTPPADPPHLAALLWTDPSTSPPPINVSSTDHSALARPQIRLAPVSRPCAALPSAGMGDRARHPRKELERLLREAEAKGWRVSYAWRGGYWRMACPCGQHLRWIHKTPSSPDYERNARGWLRRTGCW